MQIYWQMMLEYWRHVRGWSQADLAAAAGVTRQLVAAVEAGRNTPSVSAALCLAGALGLTVEAIFGPDRATPRHLVTGEPLHEGAGVRVGRVGSGQVALPGGLVDGLVAADRIELFPDAAPAALVVIGCDPILELAGALLGRGGRSVMIAHASTGLALEALAAGRTHAALAHGPLGEVRNVPATTRRFHLAAWPVGLAGRAHLPTLDEVGTRRLRVVQREVGAASQLTLARALTSAGVTARGPIGTSHADVARLVAAGAGVVGITTMSAAMASGLLFQTIEVHQAELWVRNDLGSHGLIDAFIDTLRSQAFLRRVAATFDGYDLADCGTELAA